MKERVLRLIKWVLEILFPSGKKLLILEEIVQNGSLRTLTKAEASTNQHFSLFSYKDPLVKELIWQIKYHQHHLLIQEIGLLLYEEILEILAENAFFTKDLPKVLIPVPMAPKRMRTRGWNQTEEITKAILKHDSAKLFRYSNDALEKKEGVIPQTETSSREERLRNAVGAYVVTNTEPIKGSLVIVIDDVKTTGATFQEIEHVLKSAGVPEVLCISIAH